MNKQKLAKPTLTILTIIISAYLAYSQQGVAINNSGSNPDNSAILDISSTTQGILIPRLTTAERNAIVTPASSLFIYNTTTRCFEFYENSTWQTMYCSCTPPSSPTEKTHTPSQTQVIWNWTSVAGATGYKWNTVNDYASATDMGTDTSKTETGLTCGTSYTRYVWAYNSSCGNSSVTMLTQMTSACPFSCGLPFTDPRDGKSYNTAQIGTQCWMAQNINVGTRIDRSVDQTDNAVIEKYCYMNSEDSCTKYGGLYKWRETFQFNYPTGTICPSGWHIPTEAEWLTLKAFADPNAGTKLKANWPNYNGTDDYGFTGLLAGGGYWDGSPWGGAWFSQGNEGFWWEAKPLDGTPPQYGYCRKVMSWGIPNDTQLNYNSCHELFALTVRCIQD